MTIREGPITCYWCRESIPYTIDDNFWYCWECGRHTREDYIDYLREFKGVVMQYGHNEPIRNLVIWYAPLNRFISYYSP